MYGAVEAV